MATLNQIGPQYFLSLDGGVETLKQDNELMVRPGVPGVGLKLTGLRGKPFKLRSRVDAATVVSAHDLKEQYNTLVGGGPYDLAQYGAIYSSIGVGFLVLDVRVVKISALAYLRGGLNPPSLGWLQCDWELVAVALQQGPGP
jgi:hypothetical protein